MITETVEFQLSQYADGTLPETERAGVEVLLRTDPQARLLLEEYRRLDARFLKSVDVSLNGAAGELDIRWDRLAAHLSATVAEAVADFSDSNGVSSSARAGFADRQIAGRVGFARWAAAAAVVAIAIGAGLLLRHRSQTSTTVVAHVDQHPTDHAAAAIADVSGPAVELPAGPPSIEVSIGPSAALVAAGQSRHFGEGVVYRPAKVVIAGGMKLAPANDPYMH